MSDVSFEIWLDSTEVVELTTFLADHGLVVSKQTPLKTRGLSPEQITTIIVAVSGSVIAVAGAFKAYFKHSGSVFTASTLNGKIHAENFTEEEISRMIKEASFLLMTKKTTKKKP
jgi:hypothetical protein